MTSSERMAKAEPTRSAANGIPKCSMVPPTRTIHTVLWLLSPMNCRERRSENRLLREAIGGWQINAIATFEIGRADNGLERLHQFIRLHGRCSRSEPATAISRAASRTFTHYFNTELLRGARCQHGPESDRSRDHELRGDSGKRKPEQPHSARDQQLGHGTAKVLWADRRKKGVGLRADAFNAFNHTQWSSINT